MVNHKFLRTCKTKVLDSDSKPIILKGVNLGGWLMMEGYILHAPNEGVQKFKKNFAKRLNLKSLEAFEKEFTKIFIQEKDIKNIVQLGFNCIRLPFHYRLIETKPYQYSKKGLQCIDQIIAWAKKYHIYVILDLHAAPGCQNHDWHSDSLGKAELWNNKSFQDRTCALWKLLAKRYADNPMVAGYDILNEAVIQSSKKLNSFYKKVIVSIRSVDKNHILFVEGNLWATDIACLDNFKDDNLVLSVHFYHPIDFVFNFTPKLSLPLKTMWNKTMLKNIVEQYAQFAKKRGCPIFVGEFGVNYRYNQYGEVDWLEYVLGLFKKHQFHWTYWTYKAIKNAHFPDGMFSYHPNNSWIHREGPKTGWETYSDLWEKAKKEIIQSWDTKHFDPNTKVVEVLKDAVRS
ncbi:MAG: glycoside hydrolase family 5 protein [Candidatus Aceula lacicola]|nr:glycoside hydrolase family 5 protein [Candidatus Aceula lacicola]